MANYTIRDLEKLSGIKAHTIRIWEKRYNLVEPKRTITNIRYYDDADVKKILNIAFLNRKGIKISKIATFDNTEICSQINELSGNPSGIASRIDNLVISMFDLDEGKFEKILTSDIKKFGFEDTILTIVYPFFEKVGILWQTGSINPAQEHFISNIIRRKLIAAIDRIVIKSNQGSRSFLLFLPEGELHEIGLLFYYFLARKYGHKVIYLGQSVPFDDIESVQKIQPCDFLLTSFSSSIYGIDINAYILKLSSIFKDKKILFSAYEYDDKSKHFPKNVTRIQTATHFTEFLKSKV